MTTLYDVDILELGLIANDTSIVKMLSESKKVIDIAKAVNMNPRTVEARIIRLRRKTNSDTVAGLVAYFLRKKIIE